MKNSLVFMLFLLCLPSLTVAGGSPCDLALAGLPENFSAELFLQTFEKIVDNLPVSDLDQLVVSPFQLSHPSDALKHQEAKLLKLLGVRFEQIFQKDSIERKDLEIKIQNFLKTKIFKYQNKASLELDSKERDKTPRTNTIHFLGDATGIVEDMEISPSGKLLATVTKEDGLVVYDMTSHQLLFKTYLRFFEFQIVRFSPDEKTLAIFLGRHSSKVALFDISTQKIKTTIEYKPRYTKNAPQEYLQDMAFSPDGSQLILYSHFNSISYYRLTGGGFKQKLIKYFNRFKIKKSKTVFEGNQNAGSLIIPLSGKFIGIFSTLGRLKLFDSKTFTQIYSTPQLQTDRLVEDAYWVRLSSDEKTLVFVSRYGDIFTQPLDQKDHATFLFHLDNSTLTLVAAISADGKFIALGKSDAIHIFDVEKKSMVKILNIGESPNLKIVFSKDNKFLITAHSNSKIILWRLDDEE